MEPGERKDAASGFRFSGRLLTSASAGEPAALPPQGFETTPEHRRHRHDFREILAVISGESTFDLNGRNFHLRPGDIVLVNSMEVHSNGHTPDQDSMFWWGSLWTDALCIHTWKIDKVTESGLLFMGAFNDFIYHLWDEFESTGDPSAQREIAGIISTLVSYSLRTRCRRDPHQEKHTSAVMKKIVRYMDQLPCLNCTLDSLAMLSGYSKIHFQRLFAEYIGMNFREYLLRKRVERYRQITENKHLSLKETADELGFSSVSAFLHWKNRNQEKYHL